MKKKSTKQNIFCKTNPRSGISLIVLVITIIIMIILAAAVILSLSGNGIISKANEAVDANALASARNVLQIASAEWELMSDAERGTSPYNNSYAAYAKAKLNAAGLRYIETDKNRYSVTEEGMLLVGPAADAVEKGLEIGDYVDYTPTAATSTTYKTYDENEMSETDTYFSTQSDLKWKYAGLDNDGNVMLMSDTSTTDKIFLNGAMDYLNGPTKLNNLCKELYSGTLGIARSANIDDVDRILGYIGDKGKYFVCTEEISGIYVTTPTPKTIGEVETELGFILSDRLTPDGSDLTTYRLNDYSYNAGEWKRAETQEYKLICMNGDNTETITYWLASTSVMADFNAFGEYGGFNMREVAGPSIQSYGMYENAGTIYDPWSCDSIRPVVLLKPNAQIGTEGTNGWSLS